MDAILVLQFPTLTSIFAILPAPYLRMQASKRPVPVTLLDRVPEERSVVALLALELHLLASVLGGGLVLAVAARVFPAEIPRHEDAEDDAHGSCADECAVADEVVRRVDLAVDEASDGAAEVPLLLLGDIQTTMLKGVTYESDVHGNANTSLH